MVEPIERLLFPAAESDEAPSSAEVSGDGAELLQVSANDDEVLLCAKHKLTLRCGKSSITLYPNGKIVLKGEYILSDAEGTNRINGGRIELN
jgi:hypothetical protein